VTDSDPALPIQQVEPTQDPSVLGKIAEDVRKLMTPGEEIVYVVLQVKGVGRRDAVVATTNRIMIYRPAIIGGVSFDDFSWQDVKNVHLKQGMTGSDITVEAVDGRTAKAGWLEKDQAKRLYAIAQQKEQEWREKRRVRQMEESRAAAGGVYFSGGMPGAAPSGAPQDTTPQQSPMERLAQAKSMLDAGLISEAEYDGIKAKIIASMS
jgi:Bacterial PH domain